MATNMNQDVLSSSTNQIVVSRFMSKVYTWMSSGILVTGAIASFISSNEQMVQTILNAPFLFWGMIIAEFALVIGLSASINRISSSLATFLFFAYAALNGATLSIFTLLYTQAAIQSAFYTSAAGFAGLSAFGYFTKKDLGPIGSFCTMGLFGLIGFALLSLFFPSMMSDTANQIYSIIGLIVFAGLTAFDTQRIKRSHFSNGDPTTLQKGAIIGALQLYLDFINMFLFVLRLQNRRS